jgi:hypothetical protein
MGIDLLDLIYRIERDFGVKIGREQYMKMACMNNPPDITVGALLDFVSRQSFLTGSFDEALLADGC